MSIDPTSILRAIHIGGRGDVALNREHSALSEAVAHHARDRDHVSAEALQACALSPERRAVEFHLSPLPPSAMFNLADYTNDQQRAIASFLTSCFVVTDAAGVRHEAKITPGAHGGKRSTGTYPQAPWDWYERWSRECGVAAVVEAGAVSYCRAEVGPEDTGFFWPLPGVRKLMC